MTRSTPLLATVALCVALAIATSGAAEPVGPQLPPRNPFLADSSYPLGHANSAQQDSVPMAGPSGPTRVLGEGDVTYAPVGPAHFGASTSGPYPDGRRVMWSNGLDRIVKIDHESFEVLATYWFPDARRYTEEEADASIERLDTYGAGLRGIANAFMDARKLRNLSGVYTLLDVDNTYYIGDKSGRITAYGETDPSDPASAIEPKRSIDLPEGVTGLLIGMNMTHDGTIIVATEHGFVVAIARDFSATRVARMRHSEGAEDKATGPTGYGWVRNGFAIDVDGGIYIASQAHMHKLVWTGERLGTSNEDGGWAAPYLNDWGHGTGATPSLMGFGDEDRFVVITDGQPVMRVVLFWRDEIPEDWKALPGAPDRRIAGMLPADMGDAGITAIQSEQSVVVAGHRAFVVNNNARNRPWWLPDRAHMLLVSYLGNQTRYQPYGVQSFAWNAATRTFEEAWVNTEMSSPNCVPLVSYANDRLYLVGAREQQWTLEALDADTGESLFHWVVGGARYNSLFSGTLMDERGRIHYGTVWGRVRLNPEPAASRASR